MTSGISQNQNTIHLIGELSFATVQALSKQGCQLIQQLPTPIVDLAQVTYSDNAGIALLIKLRNCAKTKPLTFINIPQQLAALLAAGGLTKLLPIATTT